MTNFHWLDWPVPTRIKAGFTTRLGGYSQAPYDSFNLAQHVGDDPVVVEQNRQKLGTIIDEVPIAWLRQVHGAVVVDAKVTGILEADASFTRETNLACCVMTADCLPVFFCDTEGRQVAMGHAGWRGLLRGVLQQTLATFNKNNEVMVYLGPAISQQAFEIGSELRSAFLSLPQAESIGLSKAFIRAEESKWMADMYAIARCLLRYEGVEQIYGGNRCTYTEKDLFYSYRRDQTTGRIANLIWME